MRHNVFNLTADNINGIEIQTNHFWFFRCHKWCKKSTFCIKTQSTVNVNKCITRHIDIYKMKQLVKFTHWIEIQINHFLAGSFEWFCRNNSVRLVNHKRNDANFTHFFKPVWKLIWHKKVFRPKIQTNVKFLKWTELMNQWNFFQRSPFVKTQ